MKAVGDRYAIWFLARMNSQSSIRQAHFLDSTRKLVEPISDNVVVEMEIEDDAIDALDFARTPIRSACSSMTQSWRYDGTLHGSQCDDCAVSLRWSVARGYITPMLMTRSAS
jgi:hypothetical protein